MEAAEYLRAEAERESHAHEVMRSLPGVVSNLEEALRVLSPPHTEEE